jgi:hypothetical protein
MQHADSAAEAIRALNHTTLGRGYESPGDVDAVLGSLHTMAYRLPQSLDQVITWLETARASGGIGHDHGINPTPAVHEAIGGLVQAAIYARKLAAALEEAHTCTAHLTGEPTWT